MNQDFIPLAVSYVMPAAIDTGLFVSLATFQSPSQDFDSAGAWDGTWPNIAGLINIPCMAPPPSDARIQATEVRAMTEILATELHHVLLDGYFPQIDAGWRGDSTPPGGWRVVIDGTAYQIMGVESDSQSQMTRVTVQLATI